MTYLTKRHNSPFNIFNDDIFFNDNFITNNLLKNNIHNGHKLEKLETEKYYLISTNLPGYEQDEIKIELKNNYIIIKAEQKLPNEIQQKNENVFSFKRQLPNLNTHLLIPKNVNKKSIFANYENGVLQLIIEKAQEPEPHKITLVNRDQFSEKLKLS